MSWRTILLTKNTKLSLRLNHLVVTGDDVVTIPLNEIGQVIIENANIVMTGHILNALSKYKITVVICDDKHMPFSHVNMIYGHFRKPQIIEKQINWTEERKEYLWQQVIKEKINNQYLALLQCNKKIEHNLFEEYQNDVELNDITNREGHAAKVYFNLLFGLDFIRGSESPRNWALNYGYTILLSLFTRILNTKGVLTELGIHHSNQYNHYNLASDFMEVYRPFVDVIVYENIFEEFGKREKGTLINLLNEKITIKERKQYIPNSIEIYVDHLIDFLNEGNKKKLVFPKLFEK